MAFPGPVEHGPDADLTVEVIRTVAGVADLEPDYVQLQACTGNVLPFGLYEWQSTWCRHFLGREPAIVDTPMFHVFRTRDRTCVGIVPLILTKRRLGGMTAASVGLLGADPAITEIRTALVRPEYEDPVALALNERLARSGEWDWIQWSGLSGAFGSAVGRLRGLDWQTVAPGFELDMPASWEAFRSGLKRNIRESLRHCYNSLKRDGHAFQVRIATDADAVRTAVGRLMELHAMRSRQTDTVDHPDRFASAAVQSFIFDVCDKMAHRGVMRVFQLEIGGQVVASRIGFAVGDSLYLYYSGYDPAWSRYSVMTTTVTEAFKYAIDQGLKTVNLSPGNDVSKTRWGPREVVYQTAYEHSGRLRSRLVRHAYLKARSGEGVQGWLLQRLMAGRRTWN